MSNPHFLVATERLIEAPAPKRSLEKQIHFMGDALTQATLALAYEQRTANLIAYVAQIDDTSASIPVVNEIRTRLQITGETK